MSPAGDALIRAAHVEEFFHHQVRRAITNQNVEASPHTEYYLVRLLSDFSNIENLFPPQEKNEVPLAILYLESLKANRHDGIRLLKQLGDFALYISGFFQDSLNLKNVDLDYYISMGGTAYDRLHSMAVSPSYWEAFADTFRDLAVNFSKYMDVLSEISESSQAKRDSDLLRLYEKWLNTGSERLARKLSDFGILLDPSKKDVVH